MSTKEQIPVGSITWFDLTVDDAEKVKNFYSKVVGWTSVPVNMGDYNDFNMNDPQSGQTRAGICHARGVNANVPPQWLIYITVENVDDSAENCRKLGGKVITGPADMAGYGRYCIIEDPAGAVAALFEPQS